MSKKQVVFQNMDTVAEALRKQSFQQSAIARNLMIQAADIIEGADGIRDVTLIDAQIAVSAIAREKGRQICCGDPRSYAPECCGSPDLYVKLDDAIAALRAIGEANHDR